MFIYKKAVLDGSPWIDFKEETKTGPELVFTFPIENFLRFILKEISITFPCVAVKGNARPQIFATANVSSTQNLFMPNPIPPELFSSPSQNFNLGTLDEAAQGMRLQPIIFNYPVDKGDTITVSVTGSATGLLIGCMIAGRKYEEGGQKWPLA